MNPKIKQWTCFHCDETFTDVVAARAHFGGSECSTPACKIDAAKLRELEHQLRAYLDEDTDLHRQIRHLECVHQTALMRAEEAGYAKGLKDAGYSRQMND